MCSKPLNNEVADFATVARSERSLGEAAFHAGNCACFERKRKAQKGKDAGQIRFALRPSGVP
jgi:hypothetical protein